MTKVAKEHKKNSKNNNKNNKLLAPVIHRKFKGKFFRYFSLSPNKLYSSINAHTNALIQIKFSKTSCFGSCNGTPEM